MKARLIEHVGSKAELRVYWGGSDQPNPCPNCLGKGGVGYHNAQLPLRTSTDLKDRTFAGAPKDYPDSAWPTKCDYCPATVPHGAERQVFYSRLYNTASGSPEPGDLFWERWTHDSGLGWCEWSNCAGPHLIAILPNGDRWNVDGRASNCTMKQDKTHRCWVRHGEPPNVHVDKNGLTCAAGAGSIVVPGWHGFLHNGEFKTC